MTFIWYFFLFFGRVKENYHLNLRNMPILHYHQKILPSPCIDTAFSASRNAILFVNLSHHAINEECNKV
jgi:hypothetical protein